MSVPKKPTYRAVNEPYLLLGVLDWRYVLAAEMPAFFAGLGAHSKLVFLAVSAFAQWRAYRIYSEDDQLPKVWLYTLLEKRHLCPFRKG
jgi:hypothetical protein